MKTSMLLVEIPSIKISYINQQSAITLLFRGDAPRILSYQNQIYANPTNLNAYRHYISAINSKRGMNLKTKFFNPFNAKESFESDKVDIEIMNTIWNFASDLTKYMLSLDSSDLEALKSMKIVLSDLLSCSDALKEITSQCNNHPFLTNKMVDFFSQYIKYICNFWQLNCIILQKESLTPKISMRCIDEIKVCLEIAKSLDNDAKAYYIPVCEYLLAYLNLYVRYIIGKNHEAKLEVGEALAFYYAGYEYSKKTLQEIVSAPQLSLAFKIVLNNIKTAIKTLKKANRASYFQSIPETPELPPPSAPANVQPGEPLLSAQSTNPNQSNVPNIQIPQSPIQQAPQLSPNFQPNAQQNVQQGFVEWDQLNVLKGQLNARVDALMSKYPEICQEIKKQFQVANQNDGIIQNAINQCLSNPSSPREPIQNMIKQASTYYYSMQARIEQMEKS
ncbi:hypothetical protein TRFO_34749 [Tritrichomonas foetus]|uniref:BRO1 domain-containing protein n=1 Tax=Tritrichomonas foetus TaxID=1144522 RepID=A0A1J4JN02_9EUKA|nr:hypothetical protein TRFO_34749 [Tritrichomonas foetus]|eukprot:OHS98915.1 hypothetical protein TRFO_34749 [Tritrichomonas foetus]